MMKETTQLIVTKQPQELRIILRNSEVFSFQVMKRQLMVAKVRDKEPLLTCKT